MIITRSPLRICLGGGGTNLPSYYRQYTGFEISAEIKRYVYITINEAFRLRIIVKDSKFEEVDCVDFQQLATSLKSKPSLAELQRALMTSATAVAPPPNWPRQAVFCMAELPEHFIQVLPKSSLLPSVPSRSVPSPSLSIRQPPSGNQSQRVRSS